MTYGDAAQPGGKDCSMAYEKETLPADAVALGFTHAGYAKIETLKTMDEVRDMCAVDKCNAYDRTWTCPPGCGTVEECGQRMREYDWGLLVQTTAYLEDSMDYEGMVEGAERQKENTEKLYRILREKYKDVLALTTASCDICSSCSYPDAPCRFPDRATAAMEGYGLLVSQVCRDNGLEYYYGKDTVTYTGLFLMKD